MSFETRQIFHPNRSQQFYPRLIAYAFVALLFALAVVQYMLPEGQGFFRKPQSFLGFAFVFAAFSEWALRWSFRFQNARLHNFEKRFLVLRHDPQYQPVNVSVLPESMLERFQYAVGLTHFRRAIDGQDRRYTVLVGASAPRERYSAKLYVITVGFFFKERYGIAIPLSEWKAPIDEIAIDDDDDFSEAS